MIDINDKATQLRISFYLFFKFAWGILESEDLKENWHIKYLCDEIQKIGEKLIRRQNKKNDLVINIPPGETKSTIVTKVFPVWLWIRDPSIRIINTSYSASLSMHHSTRSRDIIKSDKFRKMFGDITIRKDEDSKGYYKNNFGGDRLATSIGGSVTGMHAHLIIIDDAENPKEANSILERKNANDYVKHTLNTRKVDKQISATILIMQRLNIDDTTNLMLQNKNVKYICLPAEKTNKIKPKELSKYYKDGLLDPIRMGWEVLAEFKKNMGTYNYISQFLQDPQPKGGRVWQEWFIPIRRDEMPKINQLDKYGTDWDLAYEADKGNNSASAYLVSGKKENYIYIYNLGWVFKEFPELIKFIKTMPEVHYIEDKASGKSAKQSLKNSGISSKEVSVSKDKVARARDVTPLAEGGFVYVADDLIEKLYYDNKQGILNFPNNPNDDLADVLSQSLKRHYKRKVGKVYTGG